MAVVIGTATQVKLGFGRGAAPADTPGIVSVDWSFGSNINRLYTLGGGSQQTCGPKEFAAIRGAQIQISVNIYGGVTPALTTCAAQVCENSPAVIAVSIVPATCGTYVAEGVAGKLLYVSSYSYSKDRTQFGTETWQGSAYNTPPVEQGVYTEPEPTYVVLGLAEGTIDGEAADYTALQSVVGAYFREGTVPVKTWKGQVQASAISVGEFSYIFNGTFKSIGGSTFWAPGVKATASVNLATQPVYVTV